jgi:replicative DNA helicase
MGTEQWWRENRTVTQEEAQALIYGVSEQLAQLQKWLGDQENHLVNAIPPQSLTSEEGVLGCLLRDCGGREVLFAATIIRPEDFYRQANCDVFCACVSLAIEDAPVDILTIQERLQEWEMLHESGGRDYLLYLIDQDVMTSTLAWHCHRVRQRAQRRRLATAAIESLRMAHDMDMDHREMCSGIREAMRAALRDE